jgi:hypothetical protein
MKTLIRWSLTLGLAISPLFPLGVMQPRQVIALPQAEIVEFLGGIPVFSLLDQKGLPIGRQVQDDSIVTPVFMSRREAQTFLTQLQQQDPDLGNLYRIQVLPLSRIYEIARETSTSSTRLFLQYIPSGAEAQAARQLSSENGQKYPGDVPLYIAKIESDQSYLTIRQDEQELVPVFFEKATIQQWIDAVSKAQPDLADSINIKVISLSSLIANLEKNDNQLLRSLRFWPSQEMMQIIRSNSDNQNNQPR